jgi:hypothetical protein
MTSHLKDELSHYGDEKTRSQAENSTDGGPSTFADRLRSALSGREVSPWARRSGIPASTVKSCLEGTIPRADNAVKIAQALGVSVEWLVTGRGEQPPGSIAQAVKATLAESGRAYDPVSRPPPQPGSGPPSAYDRAAITLDSAARIAGIEPTESLRLVLMQILFRYDIPSEDIALLIQVASPD